jgi:hypothetical protein
MSLDQIFRDHWTDMIQAKIKPVIYLASPYTHPDDKIREDNFRKVSQIAADLNAEGHVVFSPITYGHTLIQFRDMPGDWPFWASFCFSLLLKADKMVICDTIEGWDKSRGIEEETSFARDHGIKIEYFSVWKK